MNEEVTYQKPNRLSRLFILLGHYLFFRCAPCTLRFHRTRAQFIRKRILCQALILHCSIFLLFWQVLAQIAFPLLQNVLTLSLQLQAMFVAAGSFHFKKTKEKKVQPALIYKRVGRLITNIYM